MRALLTCPVGPLAAFFAATGVEVDPLTNHPHVVRSSWATSHQRNGRTMEIKIKIQVITFARKPLMEPLASPFLDIDGQSNDVGRLTLPPKTD